MKRVIAGKAYNTATAEVIAETESTYTKWGWGGEPEWRCRTVLYRTPKGAWFTVEEEWVDDDRPEDERDVRTHFEAMTLDEALAWVRQHSCVLRNDSYFPSIEEA